MMSIIHPIASGFLNFPASISSSPCNFNQMGRKRGEDHRFMVRASSNSTTEAREKEYVPPPPPPPPLLKRNSKRNSQIISKAMLALGYVIEAYCRFYLEDYFQAGNCTSLPITTIDREAFRFDDGLSVDPLDSPASLNGAGEIYFDALDDELPALTFLEESPQPLGQDLRQVSGAASEYNTCTGNEKSIFVSFSSYCLRKRTACDRFGLLDMEFDSWSNKPLGRYLQECLFDQKTRCSSCKESADAHVICYAHWKGNLTIKVRHVDPPGEQDGRIQIWNMCPTCDDKVAMSDADLGISFGKFLEHSFSNYATSNCVASCGHSLQDCDRCFGFGSMIAFFHYSPIVILSVRLPPLVHKVRAQFLKDLLKQADSRTAASDIVQKVYSKGMNLETLLKCSLLFKLFAEEFENDAIFPLYDDEPTSMILNPTLKWLWLYLQEIIDDTNVPVQDDELTTIILCALTSKEYKDCRQDFTRRSSLPSHLHCTLNPFCGFTALFGGVKSSRHPKISFELANKKFVVTPYFAAEFEVLRRNWCIGKMDFVHSLSQCSKWKAQGGKSNAYFAKSLDDRFIIKQVTKTELRSFKKFAPKYFEYVSDSLISRNPTCLAKILGIYQVKTKHLNGGKDTKMNLLVTENLFFGANISRTYDLKGSERNRYNTPESNNGLLDMNFWEAQCTDPISLGSDAKRSLEIAVRNDASFLASVGVMDYSLLVGVDEEKMEAVIGIIDFLRQYTCDKFLETCAKASGILGGPIGASPTIIPPNRYKERFIKAMNAYFPTMPHNGHQLEGGDFVNLS